MIQATRNLPYIGGKTNTTDALRLLKYVVFKSENGDRATARNLVIFIANGESTLYADQVTLTHSHLRRFSADYRKKINLKITVPCLELCMKIKSMDCNPVKIA